MRKSELCVPRGQRAPGRQLPLWPTPWAHPKGDWSEDVQSTRKSEPCVPRGQRAPGRRLPLWVTPWAYLKGDWSEDVQSTRKSKPCVPRGQQAPGRRLPLWVTPWVHLKGAWSEDVQSTRKSEPRVPRGQQAPGWRLLCEWHHGPIHREAVMRPWHNNKTSPFGPPIIPFLLWLGVQDQGQMPWAPRFILKFFMTSNITIPPLISVALASRLWEVSELHQKLCCSRAPDLCKRLCSGKVACQSLSPQSACWVKYQTIRHPWGCTWSVERGVWSAAGPALWLLQGPDHRRWRGCQQWLLLAGENTPHPLSSDLQSLVHVAGELTSTRENMDEDNMASPVYCVHRVWTRDFYLQIRGEVGAQWYRHIEVASPMWSPCPECTNRLRHGGDD